MWMCSVKQLEDYKKNATFLCTNSSATRRLDQPTEETIANCITFAHPATIRLLLAVEPLSIRLPNTPSNKLRTIKTAARLLPSLKTRNRFLRLKVQSYLNKIWSIDLADLQKLARHNHCVNFILVAVDTQSSRFSWAMPLKRKRPSNVKMVSSPLLTISTPEETINQTL